MAPPGHRKVPFSSKQKKKQLQERKERKNQEEKNEYGVRIHRRNKTKQNEKEEKEEDEFKNKEEKLETVDIKLMNPLSSSFSKSGYDPNRYRINFKRETNEEVELGKKLSYQPINLLPETALELGMEDFYPLSSPLEIPKKPAWNYQLTKTQLKKIEEKYFKDYLDDLFLKNDEYLKNFAKKLKEKNEEKKQNNKNLFLSTLDSKSSSLSFFSNNNPPSSFGLPSTSFPPPSSPPPPPSSVSSSSSSSHSFLSPPFFPLSSPRSSSSPLPLFPHPPSLSYLELNLEIWSQLWRVINMSDLILLIVDIRFPSLHFSPHLANYITKDLNKKLILILNKIDLVSPSLVVAWQRYFKKIFLNIYIIYFTSMPKNDNEINIINNDPSINLLKKKKKRKKSKPVGPRHLLEACQQIFKYNIDFSSWKEKISNDESPETDDEEEEEEEEEGSDVENEREKEKEKMEKEKEEEEEEEDFPMYQYCKNNVLTIGCCGYPNVGKSSVINALVGKKVVSVSRTPGHTKYFQTYFLTHNIKLCDSPGLVFPSYASKPIQFFF